MSGSVAHEGFHARDGWYFKRGDDGAVKISAAAQRCTEEIVLDANTWASIVACVSARGEDGDTFNQALAFHEDRERAR